MPSSPLVNTNARYWTALAGIAWDRDVDIDFDREPIDLDGDGRADTQVTRHIRAPGGVLANPELFGLTPTPDDPRGRVGRISASTGVLGLREALRPDGTPQRRDRHDLLAVPRRRGRRRRRRCWACPATSSTMDCCWRPPRCSTTRTPTRRRYRRARGFPPGARCARGCCWRGPGGRI